MDELFLSRLEKVCTSFQIFWFLKCFGVTLNFFYKSGILMSMAEILHLRCIKTHGKSGDVCCQPVVVWAQKYWTLKMDPLQVILVPTFIYGSKVPPLIFEPRHSWGEVLPAGSPSGSPQAWGCDVVARWLCCDPIVTGSRHVKVQTKICCMIFGMAELNAASHGYINQW